MESAAIQTLYKRVTPNTREKKEKTYLLIPAIIICDYLSRAATKSKS